MKWSIEIYIGDADIILELWLKKNIQDIVVAIFRAVMHRCVAFFVPTFY